MKISYRWLEEYLELPEDMTPHHLGELMTEHGIPVEVIEPRNGGVSNVVVGRVVDVWQHPDAERLRVCSVDVGTGELLQIVCGAPNVQAGQKVPAAVVGAQLPGDVKIGKAKLRGVDSQGMLCSAKEIGLDTRLLAKEQTEGLYVLPEASEVGENIIDTLHLDDWIMELELTPNRSDCLNYRGVAYEVGAILGIPNRFENDALEAEVSTDSEGNGITIRLESEACPHYTAMVIKGVTVGPSPLWLQMRLLAVGVRPINNIVDVTNYVMFEYGQPLHAFDYNQITDATIIVRQAVAGETLVTLDGVTRKLDDSMLVIADTKRAITLAGVMGGENSEVEPDTVDVLLESAYFDPGVTRKTGKALGMRSEAQVRFEKGIDPSVARVAAKRAAQLIVELAGGKVQGEPVTVHRTPVVAETITLRLQRCQDIIGINVSNQEVQDILTRLQFPFETDGESQIVVVPTRRPDITREIDLIEEVARVYGYDKIPTTLPYGVMTQGMMTRPQKLRRAIRDILVGMGLQEAITYSLTDPAHEIESVQQIPLVLPMSDERRVLRTQLLPSLLDVVSYNVNRKNANVAVFEVGKVYVAHSLPISEFPTETYQLSVAVSGTFGKRAIGDSVTKADFFTIKGVLEGLLQSLGIDTAEFVRVNMPLLHPGKSAECKVSGQTVAFLGAIHPQVLEQWDLPETFVLQVDLAALETLLPETIQYKPLPKYPAIERDFAVVLAKEVPAGDVQQVILQHAGDLMSELYLFDVYQGTQVPEGKRSLAFRVVYRSDDRTLTDEDVAVRQDEIIKALKQTFDASLRV